jgi:thymidylate synthase
VFAHLAGLKPGIFHHTLVDAHIYTCKPDGTMGGVKNPNTGEEYGLDCDHIPALQRQVSRVPRPLPRLYISSSITSLKDITESLACSREDLLKQFQLVGYDPHLPIKMGVAV